jgi:hypothetical protein
MNLFYSEELPFNFFGSKEKKIVPYLIVSSDFKIEGIN